MTAIIAALMKFGPWLLGLAGVLFGMLRHQQAQTTEAQARQKVAEAQAQTARIEKTEADANADAERAKADALRERTDVENEIAAGAAGDSAARLRSDWSRD